MRRILRVAFVLVVLAAVAIAVWKLRPARQIADPNLLRVSGNIEATTVDISFQAPGHVLRRFVDEGQTVAAGEPVAVLDDREQVREVALRKADLAAARIILRELEAGSRPEEILAAESVVKAAESVAANAELEFRRAENLFRDRVTTERERDAALAARDTAAARLAEAQARLKLVREGPRAEEIDLARARVDQAREALALAETHLDYTRIASPLAGVVLSKNTEPGEYVVPGTPIVTIADLDHVWLRAYVSETDLGRVKLGQVARLRADSWAGRSFEGRISFIAAQAEFTPRSIQTEKERVKLVYRIKIDVPNPDHDLKPGMPVDAEIVLQ